MTRRTKAILIPAAAAALGAAVFCASFQSVGGKLFPRSAQTLDFTDKTLTAQAYEEIRNRFPDKEIGWLVPFQEVCYPQDTQRLTVEHLTAEEAAYLDYLPDLKQVDARQCTDIDALLALQHRRPECRVDYQVTLDGKTLTSDDTEITYALGDLNALASALNQLPKVQTVRLAGELPNAGSLSNMEERYPNIDWQLPVPLGTGTYSRDTESIDLSGETVNFSQLQKALPLLSGLRYLDLTGAELTEAEKRTLIQENPNVQIRCSLTVCGRQYDTDETSLDLTGKAFTFEDLQDILSAFYHLKRLSLGSVKIDNDALDALNRAYPDTDMVWNFRIGKITVSSDMTYFFPAKRYGTNLPDGQELQKLRYCPKLVAVDIGHSNARDCSWLEGTPEMKYLILADTDISDLTPVGNLKKLVYLELFRLPVEDYSPLLGCTALQDLNIGMTHADPEPLSHMTWLHNLQWSNGLNDPDTHDRVLALIEQLPDTNVDLPDVTKNIGGSWRYLPQYYVFRNLIGGLYLNQAYIARYWGSADARRIQSTEKSGRTSAAEALTQIIQRRLDDGEDIPGIKNRESDKVQILLNSLK